MSQAQDITLERPYPACPQQLSPDQIEQFHRDGYLAFTDVLSREEVEGASQSLTDLVETLRAEHNTLSSSYGSVWRQPGTKLAAQFERGHEPESVDDPDLELKVRKFLDFVDSNTHLGFLALEHERIQGVLAGLVGSDSILSQNMALVKPPFYGTEKPWHQDDAYFSIVPLEAVCGVWIALDEATAENGCMHVLPGAHKMGPLRHFHGKDCEITAQRLADAEAAVGQPVAIALHPGGALFFSGILPHQTPPNQTADRRRALQFHYRSKDSRVTVSDEYDKVFAEADGMAATCAAAARRGF